MPNNKFPPHAQDRAVDILRDLIDMLDHFLADGQPFHDSANLKYMRDQIHAAINELVA